MPNWTQQDVINLDLAPRRAKAAEAALERVCTLHKKVTSKDEDGKEYYYCDACAWSYPCPTIKVVNGDELRWSDMDNRLEYSWTEIASLKAAIDQAKSVIRLQQEHIDRLKETIEELMA